MFTASLSFVFVGLFLKRVFARSVFYLYAHTAVGGNHYCIYDLSLDNLQLLGNKIVDTVASFDMSRYGRFVFGRCRVHFSLTKLDSVTEVVLLCPTLQCFFIP